MFKSKSALDIKKLEKKIIDLKKTTPDRLKHLKCLIDNFDVKSFFEQYYQHVYFIFYETFMYVEMERRTKGQKVHRDEFEFLLVLFEKILVNLPNLVQKRWQFHSIRRLLKQLLHFGNHFKVRREGIRLFVIWYQILQASNDTENHLIFSKLVTLLPDDEAFFTYTETLMVPSPELPVTPLEILPLSKSNNTDTSSNKMHKQHMESLLTFMVSEVVKVQWENTSKQELSFRYLFNSFKSYYLSVIFPGFDSSTSVYSPSIDHLPEFGNESVNVDVLDDCQDVVIRWFTTFVQTSRSKTPEDNYKEEPPNSESIDIDSEETMNNSTLKSKSDTLTNGSLDVVQDLDQSTDDPTLTVSQHDIVYKVLLGDRENINIVHEIFRQAFMLPFTHAGAVRRVVLVYKDWLQIPEKRPLFMSEPNTEKYSLDQTDIARIDGSGDSSSSKIDPEVKAGLQNSILLFIKHSAYVFMITPKKESLTMQVDLCRRVLNIYRYMVMKIELDSKTWEQLLIVLLKVTSYVLGGKDDQLLGRHLAASLIQTLIVSWIKANLCIHMSQNLWDQLLSVLSSLSHWEELIKEWAKTMETLTRVLAKQVYKLNLSDLPLDRLSEQKSKRQRGKLPVKRVLSKKGTFSRAYSNFESTAAFRLQLTAKSSTQGSIGNICEEEQDVAADQPNRKRALTGLKDSLHASTPTNLVRSSSDSNLSGSVEKLRMNSAEDVGDDCAIIDGSVDVEGGDEEEGSESEVPSSPMSENNIPSVYDRIEENNLYTHSRHTQGLQKGQEKSSAGQTTCVTNSIENSGTEVAADNPNRRSDLAFRKVHDIPNSDVTSLTSCNISTSDSDFGGDETSLMSECSELTVTPAVSERSRSASPVSDLFSYLPGEISSFLRRDTLANQMDGIDVQIVSSKSSDILDKDSVNEEDLSRVDSVTDYRSVLTGGQLPGWTPEVAVVLWRRMLGILGDINDIKEPAVHESVMTHLLEMQNTIHKMADNMNVSHENTYSQEPGELTPPVNFFFPLCVKCLALDDNFSASKYIAIQMITKMCLRFDYMKISAKELRVFYQVLHNSLIADGQPLLEVIIRYSSPLLFGLDLPATSLFIIEVVNAASSVLCMESIKNVPRREAIVLLGTLVCFPNHFGAMEVLMPSNRKEILEPDQLKDMLLAVLLDAGRKEPAGMARCVALSSLGIFLIEELLSGVQSSKFREAVNVLLVSLRFNTKLVAWVACDMLLLLSDFVKELSEYESGLPVKIVSTMVAIFHNHVYSSTSLDDNLVISIMFCILRWCMNLPIEDLTKKDESGKSLVGKILKILKAVSDGIDKAKSVTSNSLSQEYDLESMLSVAGCTNSPVRALSRTDAIDQPDLGIRSVTIASNYVMRHLVNHICHFPAKSGPTYSYTALQECHDLSPDITDMNKEIFDSPNLQMFVFNNSTLVTVMELDKRDVVSPIKNSITPKTSCRILVRDMTGRYSVAATLVYESKVFAPPTIQRSFSHTNLHDISSDQPGVILGSMNMSMNQPSSVSMDPLDKVLRQIAEASPECQLLPGEPLDIPFPTHDELSSSQEDQVKVTSARHEQEEINCYHEQKSDFRLKPVRERSTPYTPSSAPYHVSRQLLNHLGFLSWETRRKYDLLSKSEKLLRELKHLDSQRCRETHKIAVIYVAYGQEDKQSILSNSSASPAFEKFISGLGWEIELSSHEGFAGGLQRNGTNGLTAPYYCTSTLEVLYHVSTRMPSETEDDRHRKLRHIGNDEVQVVWSEHYRPYRRGIIPTEFGDVLIIIYPLKSGLYRIQIDKKSEVSYFGPLFDGAVVSERILPALVKATAINASRVHRLSMPHFKPFFEERLDSLEKVIKECKVETIFETYAVGSISPGLADLGYTPKLDVTETPDDPELPADHDGVDSVKIKDIQRKSLWHIIH